LYADDTSKIVTNYNDANLKIVMTEIFLIKTDGLKLTYYLETSVKLMA